MSLTMFCVYCGATMSCKTVLFMNASEGEQEDRLAFETKHDRECGEKSCGMIGDLQSA